MVYSVNQNTSLYDRLNKLKGYSSPIAGSSLNGGYIPVKEDGTLEGQTLPKEIIDVEKAHDMILPNNGSTKLRAKVEQAMMVPEYAIRGLKGDPDANFFEFLKIAKIPYYIGGPMLVWCFAAGGPKASPIAKQKGVGVVLYYLAAMIANKLTKMPVKLAQGIDLDHPYRKVVQVRGTAENGTPKKKKEYHSVYESVDFSRWDLLYNNERKTLKDPRLINEKFDKIAKKMGIDPDSNDADTLVRNEIKRKIIQSRTWSYALTIPLVATAIGISNQKPWETLGKDALVSMKTRIGEAFSRNIRMPEEITSMERIKYFGKECGKIAKNAWAPIKEHIVNNFVESAKLFWKGSESASSKIIGKASIITAAAVFVLANISLLSNKVKHKDIVDVKEFPENKPAGAQELKKEVNNG